MHATENPEHKLSIVKMNSELEHAQSELLSAHSATHKLRLRFATEHLARYGRREVLRKSIETASAINDYYSSIEKQIPAEDASSATSTEMTKEQFLRAFELVSVYLREQREHYLASAVPLSKHHRTLMGPHFSAATLDQVRVVELKGSRIPSPPFFAEARALGFVNLPDLTHMNSVTYLDVIAFNETITDRALFHALVHSVQFHVLGLERYTELFVRSFVNCRFHFLVPLEAHAFFLESKFARPTAEKFSVEEQIRLWAKQNRY